MLTGNGASNSSSADTDSSSSDRSEKEHYAHTLLNMLPKSLPKGTAVFL